MQDRAIQRNPGYPPGVNVNDIDGSTWADELEMRGSDGFSDDEWAVADADEDQQDAEQWDGLS